MNQLNLGFDIGMNSSSVSSASVIATTNSRERMLESAKADIICLFRVYLLTHVMLMDAKFRSEIQFVKNDVFCTGSKQFQQLRKLLKTDIAKAVAQQWKSNGPIVPLTPPTNVVMSTSDDDILHHKHSKTLDQILLG
jgi:cyanophycinase-like exopeptidase